MLIVFGTTFAVALVAASLSLWGLLEVGKTDGRENLVLIALATFALGFAAALAVAKRVDIAAATAGLVTLFVGGGGFALIYALYSSLCGSHPSSC